MKLQTYPEARRALLVHLGLLGWTIKPRLKLPQACKDGNTLYFHPQAVYLNAHSLHLDIRQISRDEFDAAVAARIESDGRIGHGS